jgi:hypothetical protein
MHKGPLLACGRLALLESADLIGDGRGEEQGLSRWRHLLDDGAEIRCKAWRQQSIRLVQDLRKGTKSWMDEAARGSAPGSALD